MTALPNCSLRDDKILRDLALTQGGGTENIEVAVLVVVEEIEDYGIVDLGSLRIAARGGKSVSSLAGYSRFEDFLSNFRSVSADLQLMLKDRNGFVQLGKLTLPIWDDQLIVGEHRLSLVGPEYVVLAGSDGQVTSVEQRAWGRGSPGAIVPTRCSTCLSSEK